MGFVKVASQKELTLGKRIGVEAGGKQILVANVEGKFYAIENVCTHMGCMLSDGAVKGNIVTCLCHGSRFDIRTGNVVAGPAKKPEPIFEVTLEGDHILVNV